MEKKDMKKFKRSFWRLVNRDVEIKFTLVTAWLIIIGLLAGSLFTYIAIWNNLLVVPQIVSADNLLVVHQQILKLLVLEFLLGGPLVIFLAALLQFRILHRISGPVYRIGKLIQNAAEGKLPKVPVVLREKDFYNELAKAFNNLVVAIRSGNKFE